MAAPECGFPKKNLKYLLLLGIPLLWALLCQFQYYSYSVSRGQIHPDRFDRRDQRSLESPVGNMSEQQPLTTRRVVMVQYTGESVNDKHINSSSSSYTSLLDLTRPINQAYAQIWGYDYRIESGYMILDAFAAQNATKSSTAFTPTPRESLSTYNKVMILEKALTDEILYEHYDALLLLDADALVYNFSVDVVSTLLPTDKIFVAHQVQSHEPVDHHHNESNDSPSSSSTSTTTSTTTGSANVNIGVTIWNLRHAHTLALVKVWKQECLHRIRHQPHLRDSDQTPLQHVLRQMTAEQRHRLIVAYPNHELGYSQGRYIKHFIRPDAKNWTATHGTIQVRSNQIRSAINAICQQGFTATQHPSACDDFYSNVSTKLRSDQ